MDHDQAPVLVTGSTGYVGGRLVPRLLAAGHRVRAVGRSLEKMACRPWGRLPKVELAQGDVMDLASLHKALKGCRAAYYLVHSMNPRTRDYAAADRRAALNMAAASGAAGLKQIIYLGGIIPDEPGISKHLRSRAEVGRILTSGATPVTWLKAAMLLGSGSASFELMRYLVDRLPVMITPSWVRTPCQPIAVENALGCLLGVLDNPAALDRAFDIGGPEVLTYQELFSIYAQEAGLIKRLIIPVPVLSPRLSSYWIHLVTPVPASLARPLAEGLRNEVVARDGDIQQVVPQPLLSCREAIRRALMRLEWGQVETCWHDAGQLLPPEWLHCGDAPYAGGTEYHSAFTLSLDALPERIWPHLVKVGGRSGWYFGDAAWRLRGWADRLAGGPGLGRGRRQAGELQVGDALDFWRVLALDPPQRLLLLAEMKMPGQAVLELRVEPEGGSGCRVMLTARFLPRGIMGMAYWKLLEPAHTWLFSGMLQALAARTGAKVLSGPEPFDPDQVRTCRL